ncbi:MAG: DUF1273 family protein [Clostridia bacterium]|nr:DUF1273 family protein [Clostridia bacterium]
MSNSVEKTVCFTGHRPQTLKFLWNEECEMCKNLKMQIKNTITELIEKENAIHFISGMALGVDMICAEIVLELKKTYPQITLECAIPCETQAAKWTEKYRDRYFNTIIASDKETLLQTHYTADCMMKRNKYMVDKSDIVVAVWNGSKGGTANTVNYAKQSEKTIKQITL